MSFLKNHLFLTLVVLFLVIGLPITIVVLGQPTNTSSSAAAASTLSFSPPSTTSSPIALQVGTGMPVDLFISPHSNIVSFIQLELLYDPAYFSADPSSFVLNGLSLLDIHEGPIFAPGKILVSLGIGGDASHAITKDTKIATVLLKPIAKTPKRGTTSLRFGPSTQILSIGASDSTQENVLSSTTPAVFTIAGTTTGGGKGRPHK